MTETRIESQQNLTAKAQMIEDAKKLANILKNGGNNTGLTISMLKDQFPELSTKEIRNLVE